MSRHTHASVCRVLLLSTEALSSSDAPPLPLPLPHFLFLFLFLLLLLMARHRVFPRFFLSFCSSSHLLIVPSSHLPPFSSPSSFWSSSSPSPERKRGRGTEEEDPRFGRV
eukprot:478494-Rhodomonas_salina.3